MKTFTSSIVAGGLSVLVGLGTFAQANAATMPQVSAQQPGRYNGYNGRGAWIPAAQTGGVTVASAAGHASWCAAQYRTYRASDNTYQPLSGPRAQCR